MGLKTQSSLGGEIALWSHISTMVHCLYISLTKLTVTLAYIRVLVATLIICENQEVKLVKPIIKTLAF
jgi:hypothetical protein